MCLLNPDVISGAESGQARGAGGSCARALHVCRAWGLGIDGAQLYAHRRRWLQFRTAPPAAQAAIYASIERGDELHLDAPILDCRFVHLRRSAEQRSTAGPTVRHTLSTTDSGTNNDTVIVEFSAPVTRGSLFHPAATPAVAVSVQRVRTAGLISFCGDYAIYCHPPKLAPASSGSVPRPAFTCSTRRPRMPSR